MEQNAGPDGDVATANRESVPAAAAARPRRRKRSALLTGLMPLAVLVLLVVGIASFQPPFLSFYSLTVLMRDASPILPLALGQTAVILLGGIDLSMASLASLASVLIALLLPEIGGWAVLLVLIMTTVVGAAQGALHVKAQVPSFVVTLAGLSLWSGIALSIAHTDVDVNQGYDAIGWLQNEPFGFPIAFLLGLGAALLLMAGFRWLPIGRHVRATGLGEIAALFSGVRTGRVKIAAFALSGFLSGATGLIFVARNYAGSPSAANALLLPSIAAVVLGGTAITGGFGGVGRTFVGVLIIAVLRVGIAIAGVDPGYEPLAYGVFMIAAVAMTLDRSSMTSIK